MQTVYLLFAVLFGAILMSTIGLGMMLRGANKERASLRADVRAINEKRDKEIEAYDTAVKTIAGDTRDTVYLLDDIVASEKQKMVAKILKDSGIPVIDLTRLLCMYSNGTIDRKASVRKIMD